MTSLEKKLRVSLRTLGIDTNSPVVVAVSGGPDSMSLLDALIRLSGPDKSLRVLVVAHLNHLLRGAESDEDEKFVRESAGRFGLPCFVERINVREKAHEQNHNLESTARVLRYDFLRRVARNCGAQIVLTGHTQDDQVETILMRLLRGSGSQGLRGIYQIRPLEEMVKLIRPLLSVTRDEVIAHCEHYAVPFRTDISNLSTDLTRNRVRHQLLPLLQTFNPRFNQALVRTGELLAKDEEYLHQISSELFTKARHELQLDVSLLRESHPAIRLRVLRIWLREVRGGLLRIDATHLAAIENLILSGQSGQLIELPGNWRVTREFDRLSLSRKMKTPQDKPKPMSLSRNDGLESGGFIFSIKRRVPRESLNIIKHKDSAVSSVLLRECEELNNLILRTRSPGDAYIPLGRDHKIKLKTLMIRHKIPLTQRDTYPVIVTADDRIVWVPGLPVARQFAASDEESEMTEVALIVAVRQR
jgi:tRNA(Ile)-lysidine synthase